MTMCNAWLSFDVHTAKAFASGATLIDTTIGTAVLFSDGSAGYLTPGLQWRQLLTAARRDAMVLHLESYYHFLGRNRLARVLNYYRRIDVKRSIKVLKGAFDVGTK